MKQHIIGRRALLRWGTRVVLGLAAAVVILSVLHFPYDVDAPLNAQELENVRKYYAEAYGQRAGENNTESDYEAKYLKNAKAAAERNHISELIETFVTRYGLRDRPVLEIGSGRGYLQDAAQNYTGLDISSSVSRFYHKKFVLGSATAMPFPDGTFDGGWSIWVLEHVPNPEQALRECRRVMRNNAVILLFPAWNCTGWAAKGYGVRPYADFDLAGKLIKASIPIRSSLPFRAATRIPNRIVRSIVSYAGPTTLHYHRRQPNYTDYWETDADAVNGLDRHEMMLWFRSRGDECLNCDGQAGGVLMKSDPLIIRIRK
ncbi:MAG: class I SAM-dependent methyltransferase [Bryobacteraceae bacterium]|nr:class I SAM-dependent methyltransferase [Bryobacteraceae bacterium]